MKKEILKGIILLTAGVIVAWIFFQNTVLPRHLEKYQNHKKDNEPAKTSKPAKINTPITKVEPVKKALPEIKKLATKISESKPVEDDMDPEVEMLYWETALIQQDTDRIIKDRKRNQEIANLKNEIARLDSGKLVPQRKSIAIDGVLGALA